MDSVTCFGAKLVKIPQSKKVEGDENELLAYSVRGFAESKSLMEHREATNTSSTYHEEESTMKKKLRLLGDTVSVFTITTTTATTTTTTVITYTPSPSP
ncbi:hypothetical protein PoB_007080100 [Plakobranchus ocellatus]|uniref:Uncharacterized protein n=1 Tax=Plakobranchus ocellatus TaxID=259542 RepID=A0AAV4DK97_9GAST|nr:hypothetical protein PoB_007080100 [Plakobranchus ocellatus]